MGQYGCKRRVEDRCWSTLGPDHLDIDLSSLPADPNPHQQRIQRLLMGLHIVGFGAPRAKGTHISLGPLLPFLNLVHHVRISSTLKSHALLLPAWLPRLHHRREQSIGDIARDYQGSRRSGFLETLKKSTTFALHSRAPLRCGYHGAFKALKKEEEEDNNEG
jgi:hypothetical protein